jgi:16S rRNA (uracil1498-N3)-methyltransferase
MAIPRFYCPADLASNTTIALPGDTAHHAVRVLRLKDGADIVLFDGHGGQYPATLSIAGKQAFAQLGQHQLAEAELAGHITLVQGLASGEKMDWIVEKAVELGAARIVPIAAQRSVLQLSGERLHKRVDHWRRIVRSASEQCGRNRLLIMEEPRPLRQYLQDMEAAASTVLFCHPGASQTLAEALGSGPPGGSQIDILPDGQAERISLLVGPEGGWSDEEQALMGRHGLTPVTFGQRVLRTETAGLALIAAVSALREWQ